MFWVFLGFAGLMAFAVTLGKISVWFLLLKLVLIACVGIILIMVVIMLFNNMKKR